MMVDTYGVPQVSTGDMLRAAIASGSELGKKVQSYVTSGGLVPDDLVISVLLKRIASPDCAKGFILDGFPRTVGQAAELEKALAPMGGVTGVIAITVPDEELIVRLTGRRTCKACAASYQVTFTPPRTEGVGDKCGGELQQRKDDTVEVISNRLKVYHDQTSPLIEYYGSRNLLHKVEGTGKIEMIFSKIRGIIDSLKRP
jgi:adenylate kinase